MVAADQESRSLWDFYDPSKLRDIDLIISCGDLSPHYLQFLVTMAHCPLLYVRGNHDRVYEQTPPDGCVCIEDRIYDFKGLRILGLGGSMRYKPGKCMYTEEQMSLRVLRAVPTVLYHGGIDLLVTHAPAAGYGDMEDLPHRGFDCFNRLLEHFRPAYMLHGHVHKSYGHFQRQREHACGTILINAWETYILELPDETLPVQGHTGSPFYDMSVRRMLRKGSCYDETRITLAQSPEATYHK